MKTSDQEDLRPSGRKAAGTKALTNFYLSYLFWLAVLKFLWIWLAAFPNVKFFLVHWPVLLNRNTWQGSSQLTIRSFFSSFLGGISGGYHNTTFPPWENEREPQLLDTCPHVSVEEQGGHCSKNSWVFPVPVHSYETRRLPRTRMPNACTSFLLLTTPGSGQAEI